MASSMVLGDSTTLESLAPSVNAPLKVYQSSFSKSFGSWIRSRNNNSKGEEVVPSGEQVQIMSGGV